MKALSKFRTLSKTVAKNAKAERVGFFKRLLWDMDDPSMQLVDDYAPKCYGIELSDRLLWQTCVANFDISRPEDSTFYTGRPSQPAFQDMNFSAIYKTCSTNVGQMLTDDEPRVVLWQTCGDQLADCDPLDPRGLIMAYEENGRVLPVVSDFDCFTMGTRGVAYNTPLPEEQIELLKWCVSQIGQVLDERNGASPKNTIETDWTSHWLEVLKSSSTEGFHPTVPRFGFGDAQSYSIMENAVKQLGDTGAVRHGAESLNYYFPQDLDDKFLIVSDTLPGKALWKYVNGKELREFLLQKIQEGFTFPLNPKWILCDGWKEVYDSLLASDNANIQKALDIWFPPGTGVRETIESIQKRHPDGFPQGEKDEDMDGTAAMDLATLKLERYMVVRYARIKLHAGLVFRRLLRQVRLARISYPKPTIMIRD